MNFQPTREFVARGDILQDGVSIPATITGSYSTFGPAAVQCTVIPEMDKLPPDFDTPWYPSPTQPVVVVRGKTEHGTQIWISELRIKRAESSHGQISWKGIAGFFMEGDLDEFDASGGSTLCSAFVPPTPIASADVHYVKSYDGTITLSEDRERKGTRWNTRLGQAELIDQYEYVDEKVGLDNALVRVQRCRVRIHIQHSGSASLGAILRDLEDVLDEALLLVSFLSHKRIAWYGAEVLFAPGDGPAKFGRRAIARREQWLGYETEGLDDASRYYLLVKKQSLQDGLFQQLVANYEASRARNILRRVILYLLMTHEGGYIEAHLGGVYSALESLVNGLSDDAQTHLLGAADFKKLAKKLRPVIRDELGEGDIAEGVIKKLPELRRRAFLDRLLMLLEKHEVDAARLWPPDVDIPSELHELIKRRHIYIHKGRIDDYGIYVSDIYRLQGLIELWILKLLGCPDTAINPHALARFKLYGT